MEKYFFTYEDIHKTSLDISRRVKASGFEPDVIVAIGSGGFIPARIMRTFLGKPILAVGVAYYDSDDKPIDLPRKVQINRSAFTACLPCSAAKRRHALHEPGRHSGGTVPFAGAA